MSDLSSRTRVKWPARAVVTAGMPYGNKPLHFGHIGGVFVPADAFARFLRDRIGADNVRFISGTDCFGSPINEGYRKLREEAGFDGTIADYVERNHEEIRRILVKGSSFDALTQEDVNLALSHVNSAPRPSLDGKTPYDEFVSFHGERGREFLEKLGIRRVNAESVVLDPILLGEKFKKEANRAILHRHGAL